MGVCFENEEQLLIIQKQYREDQRILYFTLF